MILAVRIIDTVEVSGSNPLLLTIPLNNLRDFPGFCASPPRSNKARTGCITTNISDASVGILPGLICYPSARSVPMYRLALANIA